MFDRDAWLEVAHNVLSHPLRTTLTGISVALGIFILVVMQGLGYGLQHGVEGQFADDAVNSIWVEGGRTQIAYRGNQSNRPVRLTNADLPGIASQADTIPDFSRRIRLWGAEIVWENPEGENKGGGYGVRGVDPAHIELERSVLLSGRYINERDVRLRKVAVVGPNIVQDLLKDRSRRDVHHINAVLFQVVGTFEDPGSRWENGWPTSFSGMLLYRTEGGWTKPLQYGRHGNGSNRGPKWAHAVMVGDVKAVHPDDSRGMADNNNKTTPCMIHF